MITQNLTQGNIFCSELTNTSYGLCKYFHNKAEEHELNHIHHLLCKGLRNYGILTENMWRILDKSDALVFYPLCDKYIVREFCFKLLNTAIMKC